MVLIPASSPQLIWTFCRRSYIIIWCPPTSCERHNSHSIQPFDSQGCPLISLTRCTCYLHRCLSSFDSLAGVNMLHRLYHKIPENFQRLILQDGIWFVHIPLISMVKCKFLAQSSVDLLHYPVKSCTLSALFCCIRLLCNSSLCLYHHIIYTSYPVAYFLYSL